MATPHEKLAESLEALHKLQAAGRIAIRSEDLSRLAEDAAAYLKQIEEVYMTDAYHSLSIEGYRFSPELIDRVRQGTWNPELNDTDQQHKDALAARGYWQAFQAVEASIQRILKGEPSGDVADNDHSKWYRELFAPSVEEGICKPSDLAGYRNGSVYIRRSKHVPLSHEAVRDAMLASGGYPWTIIPVEKRAAYLSALEAASVDGDVVPFVRFLADCVGAEVELT